MSEFRAPDLTGPLRLEERFDALSPTATVKGMFFGDVVTDVEHRARRTPGRGRYLAFRDYPFREWIELLVEGAELAYTDVPPLEGIRAIGRRAYPLFKESVAGAVIVALAGRSIVGTLRHLPRALRVSQNVGHIGIAELTEGRAVLQLRELYDFPEAYYVGVVEGILAGFEAPGEVLVRDVTLCDADLLVTW